MHLLKRLAILLACCVLLLAGCKSDSTGKVFRYDIPEAVVNLDPQFASDSTARLILGNLVEGLLVQSADGEIEPGVAESYTLSEDKMTYTFQLREDAAWQGGEPVLAADFVFAFHRMFTLNSPFASGYAAIQNARDVMDGRMSATMLGVKADGDHTLTITLDHPDPFFPERLCDPCAAPCNQKMFEESRGRFGLEPKFVPSNGPFYLHSWDNEKSLALRQNENYRSEKPAVAGRVTFYVGRENATDQFLDGKTDLALLPYDQQEKLDATRANVTPIRKTVWCIVFNQNDSEWGNALLRQGLAYTVDHQSVGEGLPVGFAPTSVLVPDAISIMGKPFRESALAESPLALDTQQGQRLFELGLKALGRDQLPTSTTIYIPEIARDTLHIGATVQQGWQKYLSAYINFVVATPREIENRFQTGDYQMLLMRFTPATADITSLLGAFASDSSQNHFGYNNVRYDELLQSAKDQDTVEKATEKYVQAETMLLSDAVVIPLYSQTTYLAVDSRVQGLEVSPFGDRIQFKYASKDG